MPKDSGPSAHLDIRGRRERDAMREKWKEFRGGGEWEREALLLHVKAWPVRNPQRTFQKWDSRYQMLACLLWVRKCNPSFMT